MIAAPLLPSKRAVNGALLGREPRPVAKMVSGRSFGQWQRTLEGNSSLSLPAISGVRLYEYYFNVSQ
jgi:hypothetical protein